MVNEHDIGKRLKRKPSLQKCVEWLTNRKSFASLVEKTVLASSQRRATSPIRKDASASPADASPSSTRRANPPPTPQGLSPLAQLRSLSRAATPPPQIDAPISTSPIDWSSPVLPIPKPAADTRARRPLSPSTTKEELATLREQARQNINARAAAAIAAGAAAAALPVPDWPTACAPITASAAIVPNNGRQSPPSHSQKKWRFFSSCVQ